MLRISIRYMGLWILWTLKRSFAYHFLRNENYRKWWSVYSPTWDRNHDVGSNEAMNPWGPQWLRKIIFHSPQPWFLLKGSHVTFLGGCNQCMDHSFWMPVFDLAPFCQGMSRLKDLGLRAKMWEIIHPVKQKSYRYHLFFSRDLYQFPSGWGPTITIGFLGLGFSYGTDAVRQVKILRIMRHENIVQLKEENHPSQRF